MSILQSRIAREFGVGQARAAEKELIGANRVGREKIVRARSADNVVLIDAIAANADRADENTVAIKSKTARENRDAVWQISANASAQRRRTEICRGRESHVRFFASETGKLVLLGEERAGIIPVDAGRIILLRQKSDAAGRHRNVQTESEEIVSRIENRRPRFLDGDVPTEHGRFAGAKCS